MNAIEKQTIKGEEESIRADYDNSIKNEVELVISLLDIFPRGGILLLWMGEMDINEHEMSGFFTSKIIEYRLRRRLNINNFCILLSQLFPG